ncbi:MAG: S1 RNA-binding domain-containing protein [Chloroflexota bacterium]
MSDEMNEIQETPVEETSVVDAAEEAAESQEAPAVEAAPTEPAAEESKAEETTAEDSNEASEEAADEASEEAAAEDSNDASEEAAETGGEEEAADVASADETAADAASEASEEAATEEAPEEVELTGIAALKRKDQLAGTVTRLELYGAFIDVGLENQALIHISKLGNEHVNRVSDVLSVGQEVTVWVEKADATRKQIMVTMIEPLAVEWRDLKNGQTYTGTVSRLENYGAFVNIGAEREGLVHISELSHDYVKQPSEVVSVGDEVQVQVLGFSKRKRRIDLSMKALMDKPTVEETFANYKQAAVEEYDYDDDDDIQEEAPTAMEFALRKAFGGELRSEGGGRRRPKSNKKNRRRDRRRSQQDALLQRTLYRDE